MGEEAAFFAAHGWIVLRGAIAAERIARWREAFDVVLPPACYAGCPDEAVQLPGLVRRHPVLGEVLAERELFARIAGLLATDRLQLLQDALILKAPGARGKIDWHQDYTYTGYLAPPRTVSLRIALGPCVPSTGGMYVVDGSHAWGPQGGTRALADEVIPSALDGLPAELAAAARAHIRPVELEPGDVSLHHCLTLHGSFANPSAEPRRTIVLHLFDGHCTLDASRLPSPEARAHFPTDEAGRLVGEAFPRLFQAGA